MGSVAILKVILSLNIVTWPPSDVSVMDAGKMGVYSHLPWPVDALQKHAPKVFIQMVKYSEYSNSNLPN